MAKQWTPEAVEKMTSEEVREVFVKNMLCSPAEEIYILLGAKGVTFFEGQVQIDTNGIDISISEPIISIRTTSHGFLYIPLENVTYRYEAWDDMYIIENDNFAWFVGDVGIDEIVMETLCDVGIGDIIMEKLHRMLKIA